MKNKPPGWYRKTSDRRQHGYWDGRAWVEPTSEDIEELDEQSTTSPPERP